MCLDSWYIAMMLILCTKQWIIRLVDLGQFVNPRAGLGKHT